MFYYFWLGVIEGLTEFLPISSTGHLILYSYFSGVDLASDFIKTNLIVVQFAAILAVVFLYYKEIFKYNTFLLLCVSALPTFILGFLFKDIIDRFLELPIIVAINLILGGIVILFIEYFYKKKSKHKLDIVSYKEGIKFGLIQSLAMIPGMSRSGAIIMYGLYKNYDRGVIAKFSFLLAVPTMFVASSYMLYKNFDLFFGEEAKTNIFNLSFSFLISFVVAVLVIKFLLHFIKKYSFTPFAIYRIILGLVMILILM